MFLILIVFLAAAIFIFSSQKDMDTGDKYNDWQIDKKEYPHDEYTLDELPVSHRSSYEVRQFFEDSDADHDGILKGVEINSFDYRIKHSQFTYNGAFGYN